MRFSREIRALILLVVVFAAAAIKAPRLLEPSSISSILLWIPLLTVMAVGQMLVIVSRGIDVSVGSILGFAGIAVGMLFRAHPDMNVYLGAGIALAIGAALGAVNGMLVAWAKIPAIITTLGTLSAYRGLTFILSKGEQIDSNNIPIAVSEWSMSGPFKIGGVTIPWILVFTALVVVIGHVFARRTVTGRNLYAIGSNMEAARLHGVNVNALLILAYAACGALAGFAGIMYASRYGFVNPGTAGFGMELTVIAATVIGGTDVRGGSGSVPGVVIGCVLLGVINVALAVIGIAADWQLFFYGAIILVAVGLDAFVGKAEAKA
ncbi:MAG TPA: ABC transporter permease [Fimbriimonadaceae bacterium]|nr:ABC transporter permease [Fimbriimonadaceae bacterium]